MNINEVEKYLPAGTIVLIKSNFKTLMIVGYKFGDDKKDYIGVYYPEGYAKIDYLIHFNHEDITKIVHLGLKFKKQQEYNKFLLGETKCYKP